MLRTRLPLIVVAIAGAFAAVSPGFAQFGTIFGGPPRPPADIPGGQRGAIDDERFSNVRPQQQIQPSPWTREPQVVQPPPGGYPPPYPQQAYPPPGGYQQPGYPPPPQQASRPPGVQQQELPPPGQRQPRGNPGDTPTTPAPPNDEVVIEPPAQKVPNQQATFSGLDKITGRIISFDVAINETVQFGALQVTPRVCYTRPPTETPNTDSFLEVDEITLQGEIKRLFTGWMFAASPGLHAIEHPIYDVWLADCKGPQAPTVAEVPPAAQQPQQPPPRPQQRAKQPAQPKAAQQQQPGAQPLPPPPQRQQPQQLPPPQSIIR